MSSPIKIHEEQHFSPAVSSVSSIPSPPPTPPKAAQRPDSRSSSESGFFQQKPRLPNQFEDDIVLKRILSLYTPIHLLKPLHKELDSLGSIVLSSRVLHWLEDAEAHPPTVKSHDAFSNPSGELKTSEGWRNLSEFGAREGMVAEGYEGRYGRMGQFAKYYLFSPSSALTTCPFAMTDGAARLLSHHASQHPNSLPTFFNPPTRTTRQDEKRKQVFGAAYTRLVSRDPSIRWTSGQWMTERSGGSDVSRSETVAVYSPLPISEFPNPQSDELGPWLISGYKFFSSASDSDMAILLAKTSEGKLSAFFAPLRLPTGERNGVKIVRLKKKLGTKALPTAEMELKGMRAWMIGEEGEGIHEISTVLNITRVHNAVSAVSFMRRGLSVAKSFAKVRMVARNKPLWTMPLHLRTLAHLELLHRASMHLTFFTIHLLSITEANSRTPAWPDHVHAPSAESAAKLFRLMTPMAKALTAKLSISSLSECCESLGGLGYCENEEPFNLSRILRDCQVLSIWEGTTNVLVTDLIGSLKRTSRTGGERRGWGVLHEFIEENLGRQGRTGEIGEVLEKCKIVLWTAWKELEALLEMKSREELTGAGRILLWRLGWMVCGVLMIVDARRDGDRAAVELARRWILEDEGAWGFLGGRSHNVGRNDEEDRGLRRRAEEDCWVVFGEELPMEEIRPKL
ncbi:hypothetical protein RUND412_010051 [Rhizina undulata]